MRFRKKPVVIEAMQYTAETCLAIHVWLWPGDEELEHPTRACGELPIVISTLEGEMKAEPGDWIICGVKGEFYPCRSDIFEATYEEVVDGDVPVPEVRRGETP